MQVIPRVQPNGLSSSSSSSKSRACNLDACSNPFLPLRHAAGMETATSAAAAGGTTTVIDMPLNSFPTTTNVKELLKKMAIAEVSCEIGG